MRVKEGGSRVADSREDVGDAGGVGRVGLKGLDSLILFELGGFFDFLRRDVIDVEVIDEERVKDAEGALMCS